MVKKAVAALGLRSIGWQGVEFQLPEDWNFVEESGGRRNGSMGFVSTYATFELKWEEIKKKGDLSVESVADNLVKKLDKSIKNLKALKKGSTKVFGHNAVYLHLETDLKGYGITWYCEDLEKMFIGLFIFKPAELEKAKLIFNHLLGSIKCHSVDGWERWSVLGFSFKTPSNFKVARVPLEKALLGRNSLFLHAEEQHPFSVERTEVYFDYWSAANVIFEEVYSDPKRWFKEHFEEQFRKRYRGKMRKGRFQKSTIKGHTAKVLKSTVKRGSLEQTVTRNNTYMWYCPNTNRIYALTLSKIQRKQQILLRLFKRFVSAKKQGASSARIFDEILGSVSCH